MSDRTGSIHYAKYQESPRLQRFLALMLDGHQRTTREIDRTADIQAVNSAACELRMNGFDVRCIKKSKPAIYQLFGVAQARHLSARLLEEKAAA